MKRIAIIFVVLMMLLSAMSIIVYGAEGDSTEEQPKCTYEIANIAKTGTVSTNALNEPDNRAWIVVDHLTKLIDGNWERGLASSNKDAAFSVYLTFAEPVDVQRLLIVVNGKGVASDNIWFTDKASNSNINLVVTVRNEDEEEILKETHNTKDKTTIEIALDGKDTSQIELHWANCNWNNALPIWELEVYAPVGEHVWTLDKVTTDPSCTETGIGDYKCECGATKSDTVEPTGHNPDNTIWIADNENGTHYNSCQNGCGLRTNEEEHSFDDDCDISCDTCGATRAFAGHKYTSECDPICDNCKAERVSSVAHTYSADCVGQCSNCEYQRENVAEHEWLNACDDKCNKCSYERVPSKHEYDAVCDEGCGVCGFIREDAVPHEYKKPCSMICSVCLQANKSPAPHSYSNACDISCNECGFEREQNDHVYDNLCDDTCNKCLQKRTDALPNHAYLNNCDFDCNECGAQRTPSKHIYGEWIETLAPTEESVGQKARYCVECGEGIIEGIPMLESNTGLSRGALTAVIVASSVTIVGGCTGIAVYSMVIKPKIAKRKLEAQNAQRRAETEVDDEDLDDEAEYDDEDSDDDTQQ